MDGDGITIYGVMKSHLLRFRRIYGAVNLQRQSAAKKKQKFLLLPNFFWNAKAPPVGCS